MAILKKLRKSRGFTLVELMIVVVIIGILASLAIYGVQKYVANSKSAEARLGVGAISKGAVASYQGERMAGEVLAVGGVVGTSRAFCGDSTSTKAGIPATVPAGQKYQSGEADWNDKDATSGTGWGCLKFSMTGPQYYQYAYTATIAATPAVGNNYLAVANGDLDGDGILSSFTLKGELITDSVAGLVLTVAPSIVEVNPSE